MIVDNLYARSVFFVKDAELSLKFYTEILGFWLPDKELAKEPEFAKRWQPIAAGGDG
jgi:catechol 2,3-dioxygenase-like lactoylglutathione lyase family enzyme